MWQCRWSGMEASLKHVINRDYTTAYWHGEEGLTKLLKNKQKKPNEYSKILKYIAVNIVKCSYIQNAQNNWSNNVALFIMMKYPPSHVFLKSELLHSPEVRVAGGVDYNTSMQLTLDSDFWRFSRTPNPCHFKQCTLHLNRKWMNELL